MVSEFVWKDKDFHFTFSGKKYILKNAKENEVDDLLQKGNLGRAICLESELDEVSFCVKKGKMLESGVCLDVSYYPGASG